jgi:hypothetical protein
MDATTIETLGALAAMGSFWLETRDTRHDQMTVLGDVHIGDVTVAPPPVPPPVVARPSTPTVASASAAAKLVDWIDWLTTLAFGALLAIAASLMLNFLS